VEVGAGVSDFKPGDKVIAINFPVRLRDACLQVAWFLRRLDSFFFFWCGSKFQLFVLLVKLR